MGSPLTSHFKDGKQELPELPPRQTLSASVVTVLGMNPGPFALTGTNTYLVGTGAKRILIDTGEGRPEYIANLKEAMAHSGATGLQEVIVTHWHFDHLGGVPSVLAHFGNVPVRKIMPEAQEALFGGEGSVDPYSIWPRDRFTALVDGEIIRTEGATLKVMHTPGHANDHAVLVHQEERAIFTGDNVLGVGTSVFVDLAAYMASLQRMRDVAVDERLQTLYPAHGPIVPDAQGKLQEYIAHRQQRINQVKEVLEEAPAGGMTCEEITRKMYPEVPERLLPAAANNTMLVLRKLEEDRLVAISQPNARWSRRASKL